MAATQLGLFGALGLEPGAPGTVTCAGKAGQLVTWPAGTLGPFDPPAPGEAHPNSTVAPGARYACPHCGRADETHAFADRDACPANEVHPSDCRCGWCRHGVTWRRADDGRGAPLVTAPT